MYDPVKDGVAKTVASVVYREAPPPATLRELVHCFWELRTVTDLVDDFTLHAMPDACVNLLFNQHDTRIAGVTQLHTTHTTLDLGRSFHYAGIQFFPGVWRGDPDASVDHYVGEPYEGELPLVEVGEAAADADFEGKATVFAEFVATLVDAGLVAPNPVTAAILTHLDDIHSVGDMAEVAALAPPAPADVEGDDRFRTARPAEGAAVAALVPSGLSAVVRRSVALHTFVSKADRLHTR